MDRMYKAFVIFMCLIVAVSVFPVIASAVSVNGISSSSSSVSPGDSFIVTLNIPKSENADTVSIRVEFDSSTFEVTSWEPQITNGLYNKGDGFFVVSSANATRAVEMGSGLVLKAGMSVKKNAKNGNYSIKLVKNSISYVKDNGYEYVELWDPTVKEVTIQVGKTSGGGAAPEGTTSANTTKVIDTPDDDPGDESTTTSQTQTTTAEEIIVIDDDENTGNITDENNDTTAPVTNKINITLNAVLDGLPKGKIGTSTKTEFFSKDTEINISNTATAKESASYAIENLGFKNHVYYPFDISLFETATGKKVRSLDNGYIDFSMPIPKIFGEAPYELNVYHIEGGYPQLISSSVVFEDGQGKIKFRANSFSPYMIVDMVGELAQPDHTNAGTKGNVPGNGGSGRPLNPNTGVGAAIIIPSALVGCAVLSRKTGKHRRRTRKFIL